MLGTRKYLEASIDKLTCERDRLLEQNTKLKLENKGLLQTTKMKEEQIAHKIAMREETADLKLLRDKQEIENDCAEKVRKVQTTYQEKVEKQLNNRNDELRNMYSEILARLPDISVRMKK